MKPTIFVTAMVLTAGLAFASPDILPTHGIAGTITYDMATGQQTPADWALRRSGRPIWSATESSGSFYPLPCTQIVLDWGDVESPAKIGGFAFGYATNSDSGITCVVGFYANDNGWNTPGRDFIVAFGFTDLAGTLTPDNRDLYWSWIYRVEPVTPFIIDADDLDGDLLGDFGYTYWFDCATYSPPGTITGPLIAGDPNTGTAAPGAEPEFDIYNDPNYIPAPGYIDPNLTSYMGTYSFGWLAQFYMELSAAACPNRGDYGHYCSCDANGDCIINLSDLAELLGHYGAPWPHVDCYPYDPGGNHGDGTIDLGDLAELLSEYGDNCNWPRP